MRHEVAFGSMFNRLSANRNESTVLGIGKEVLSLCPEKLQIYSSPTQKLYRRDVLAKTRGKAGHFFSVMAEGQGLRE